VTVDLGGNNCQVPFAPDYIRKVQKRGSIKWLMQSKKTSLYGNADSLQRGDVRLEVEPRNARTARKLPATPGINPTKRKIAAFFFNSRARRDMSPMP